MIANNHSVARYNLGPGVNHIWLAAGIADPSVYGKLCTPGSDPDKTHITHLVDEAFTGWVLCIQRYGTTTFDHQPHMALCSGVIYQIEFSLYENHKHICIYR